MRKILSQKSCTPIIGAFNGLIAKAIAAKGHQICYVSGGAVSASLGVPDIGLLSLPDFTKVIRQVERSSGLAVFADADTGFGNLQMIRKVVVEYSYSGASGLHIQDQKVQKRCGHLNNKTLISKQEMGKKIQTACLARDYYNKDMIICARTDAQEIDKVVQRAEFYIDSGADMVFPQGLKNVEEFERVKEFLGNKCWLLANMTEFGKTQIISIAKFAQIGYNAVLYPVSTLRVCMKAVDDFLEELERNQVQSVQKMQTREELYRLLEYRPDEEWKY